MGISIAKNVSSSSNFFFLIADDEERLWQEDVKWELMIAEGNDMC